MFRNYCAVAVAVSALCVVGCLPEDGSLDGLVDVHADANVTTNVINNVTNTYITEGPATVAEPGVRFADAGESGVVPTIESSDGFEAENAEAENAEAEAENNAEAEAENAPVDYSNVEREVVIFDLNDYWNDCDDDGEPDDWFLGFAGNNHESSVVVIESNVPLEFQYSQCWDGGFGAVMDEDMNITKIEALDIKIESWSENGLLYYELTMEDRAATYLEYQFIEMSDPRDADYADVFAMAWNKGM